MNPTNSDKKAPDIRKFRPTGVSRSGLILSIVITVMIVSVWFGINRYFLGMLEKEVPLNEIVNDIADGEYKKIVLEDDSVTLQFDGTITQGGREFEVVKSKYARISPNTDFYQLLSDADVNLRDIEEDFYQPSVGVSVTDIITIILFGSGLVLLYIMIRSMQASGGRLMDFGQSKARLIFGKKTGISFEDVAGIDEVREELVELVDFLKSPKKYLEIGARIPRGVLLVGAPGTGKTLLAKAVAGEAGVPFFHTSGSEFEEMLVGAGASRVRDLFAKAKRAAPCIIFIDEIDAVAKKRGTVLHTGSNEQTLNQVLVEMDGLEQRDNVIVLAATNRPDVLDPAILRPGRFDRTIMVSMPDYEGRLAILQVHARNKKFEEGVSLESLARKTIGYSGADLENILNEAAIMAAGAGRKAIAENDLLESFLKVKLGRQKKNRRTSIDLRRVAFHEAGHAVVAKFDPDSSPVEKISIISRGGSGGVTVYVPEEEMGMLTVSQLRARIRSAVGGKIAEELFMKEMTTGASSDIKSATEIAKAMVQQYGMSEKLGFVKYGNLEDATFLGYQYGGEKDYSEETARLIDGEVRKLIDDAQKYARDILTKNKAKVEELVELLLAKEEVDRSEFDALFA